jgi:hypothetical protein
VWLTSRRNDLDHPAARRRGAAIASRRRSRPISLGAKRRRASAPSRRKSPKHPAVEPAPAASRQIKIVSRLAIYAFEGICQLLLAG